MASVKGSSASKTAVRPGTPDPNFRSPQGTQYSGNLQSAIQKSNLQSQANLLENRKKVAAQQAIQNQEQKQVTPTQSSISNMVSNMDAQRDALSGFGQQRTPQELNQLANLNTAIGFNPTTGMGPINSMKYQFTNPQFRSDLSRLASQPIGIMGLGMHLLKKAFGDEQPTGIASLPTMFGGPRMPMIPTNPNLIDTGDLGIGMGDYGIRTIRPEQPIQTIPIPRPDQPAFFGANTSYDPDTLYMEEKQREFGGLGFGESRYRDNTIFGVDPNDAFSNAYTNLDTFNPSLDTFDPSKVPTSDLNPEAFNNLDPRIKEYLDGLSSDNSDDITINPYDDITINPTPFNAMPSILTYGEKGLPVTYGTNPNDIFAGGNVGYSGTVNELGQRVNVA